MLLQPFINKVYHTFLQVLALFTGKILLFTEKALLLASLLLPPLLPCGSFVSNSTKMTELENKIEDRFDNRRHQAGSGRVWTGLFILLIGVAALMKSFFLPLPGWLFSWQMLLIVLGLFIGVRHNFRGGAWAVLILIGSVFLFDDFFPNLIESRFLWPIALIAAGLFIIAKPRRHRWNEPEQGNINNNPQTPLIMNDRIHPEDDMLDSTSVFGGIKKSILSKNFRGGDVVNIMGGAEINLSQADINGRVELEVTQIFGGTKIIVPPHWDVKPEMAAIFGGIDDKRNLYNVAIDHSKVLILKGTSIFGGIEVKSF